MCKLAIRYLVNRDLKDKKRIIKGGGKHTDELIKLCEDSLTVVGIWAGEILYDSLSQYRKLREEDILNVDADLILISSFYMRESMKNDCKVFENKIEIYDFYDHGIEKEFF